MKGITMSGVNILIMLIITAIAIAVVFAVFGKFETSAGSAASNIFTNLIEAISSIFA